MASGTSLSSKILYNWCGVHQLDLKLQLIYKELFIAEDDVAPENERDFKSILTGLIAYLQQ